MQLAFHRSSQQHRLQALALLVGLQLAQIIVAGATQGYTITGVCCQRVLRCISAACTRFIWMKEGGVAVELSRPRWLSICNFVTDVCFVTKLIHAIHALPCTHHSELSRHW